MKLVVDSNQTNVDIQLFSWEREIQSVYIFQSPVVVSGVSASNSSCGYHHQLEYSHSQVLILKCSSDADIREVCGGGGGVKLDTS